MSNQAAVPRGDLLGSADHPVVVVRRTLHATPAEVWEAWTDPDRVVRWLGAVAAPLTTVGRTVDIAMAAAEQPTDPGTAENLARFTVLEADPPAGRAAGRLVFVFDDRADPGGVVTVTMAPEGDDRCRLVLQHALAPAVTALDHVAGFGAGWEGFLDWLEDALAGRAHGGDETYEALKPAYERRRDRLALVAAGTMDDTTVRHHRVLDAPIERVWSLLTTPDGVGRWLGELEEGGFGPDGTVTLVHEQSPSGDMVQRSRITTWEPPTRLAMTWEFTGEPTSSVEVTLRADGSRTHLDLVHHDLTSMPDQYLAGWHAHLDVLSALAEDREPPPWQESFNAATASTR
jgi:uncharacterized protein YndB with AHSA1/START domain